MPYNIDFLFPLPVKNRITSAETVRIRDPISYWSPASEQEEDDDAESESLGEEEEYEEEAAIQSSPETAGIETPLDIGVATAVSNQGLSTQEIISEAIEWAWLVPFVGVWH